MSTTSTALMTAEELMELPHGEGFRYELIHGELEKTMSAGFPHGRITMRLAGPLSEFIWSHDLGEIFAAETGFQLTFGPDTVLAPDISFITKERLAQVGETERFWPAAPDLVVEVLSPSDRPSKVNKKTSLWLSYGAKQVWIVNRKNRTVTVYRSPEDATTFSGSGYLEAPDLLPGFRLSLDRIFSTSIQE
ncbi:MAG TPA: Uma2 family endonuclease [Pyrinomonadaceae bacterium]|nr:Uma2 family endonuclease [Pyrinomonadaceae bacterium]